MGHLCYFFCFFIISCQREGNLAGLYNDVMAHCVGGAEHTRPAKAVHVSLVCDTEEPPFPLPYTHITHAHQHRQTHATIQYLIQE